MSVDGLLSQKLDLTEIAFEAAPHGYLLLDPDFTIVNVNRCYLDLTGSHRADLVGMNIFEAFPDNPEDPTADGVRNLRLSLETARETQQPHAMAIQRYDIPVRDGEPGDFEQRYWKPLNTPVIEGGAVVGLIHHVEDVTEQIVLQRDQAIRWRSAQKLHDLALWEYDHRTRTAFVSRPFAAMQGLADCEGTMSAEVCFEPILAEDRAAVEAAFAEAAQQPDHSAIAFVHRVVLPGGDQRWLSSHGELVRDHRSALPRFLLVSNDITETKRREVDLARAVEERDALIVQKEALLGEVNHRIKNSLQLVSSILNTDARRAEDREIRSRLMDAASRVNAVTSVHEMLYQSNEVSSVAFGPYLRDLCDTLAAGDAQAVQAELTCDPVEVRLSADKAIPLALMVNELVANAIKHGLNGSTGGRIAVSTSLEGEALILSVSDTGKGKAETATPGLGTRIIDGLVAQLGATMAAPPDPKGHTVTVRVPIEPT
ncbi:sensor histidine kinase [Poseidonocella sedimentorum]|uniref:histidine kinase n=1 Tax=Poseidonocella sedimentorum TaxID=871652 RepID=A0A1I6CUU1_9RHOB|nr:histidine kinase dimerization/phosphoacceptor domain -containing protein [Poseidonocella sedimentorum]SFQ96995.1 PAS domain S-box-containing protein [Poseidonocella sedimentorum]